MTALLTRFDVRANGVPAAFAIVALVVAAMHATFTEFDGLMQLFAGREMLDTGRYRGWPSHFWPPLFPLLTGALEPVTGGFWAGKIVSIASAAAILILVYRLTLRVSGGRRGPAIAAQLLVAVNPLFFLNAIQAQNHMLDAALFVGAVYAAVIARDTRGWVVAGLLAGAASMTRYTSVVLLPAGMLLALTSKRERPLRDAAAFVAPALLVAMPWLLQNWALNGSPVATWQHLNIGSAYLDPDDSLARWWWLLQAKYHNVLDILRAGPSAYLRNAASNAWNGLGHLGISMGAAIAALPFVAAGIKSPDEDARRARRMTLFALTLLFALIVQAFLRDYLFLASSVLLTVLGVAGAARMRVLRRSLQVGAALLVLAGGILTVVRTGEFIDGFNSTTTVSATAAGRAIRADIARTGNQPKDAAVMAVHPIYAYECGCRFLMTPLYYEGSLEGFVSYVGLAPEVRAYAPRAPSTTPLNPDQDSARYLVFNRGLRNFVPQYEYLLDPASARVPPSWRLVFGSTDLVVYAIR